MDELHAAIAEYLAVYRGITERRRLAQRAEVDVTIERARQVYGHAEGRYPAPRCQVCGRLVDDDGGLFNLADMQTRRRCAEHYVPF